MILFDLIIRRVVSMKLTAPARVLLFPRYGHHDYLREKNSYVLALENMSVRSSEVKGMLLPSVLLSAIAKEPLLSTNVVAGIRCKHK